MKYFIPMMIIYFGAYFINQALVGQTVIKTKWLSFP